MDRKEGNLGRRDFILLLSAVAPPGALLGGEITPSGPGFHNELLRVSVPGSAACLWSYRLTASGKEYHVAPPVFNVDNRRCPAALTNIRPSGPPSRLTNGATEYKYEGAFTDRPSLFLEMIFQAADNSPIVRFSYILKAKSPHVLTKPSGRDDLAYLGVAFGGAVQAKEIRFANFLELTHCYVTEEVPHDMSAFKDNVPAMGPVLVGSDGRFSALAA